MSALDQLALFEPEGQEAARLLDKWMRTAELHARNADRCEVLGLTGAQVLHERVMGQAMQNALVFALLLDLEREAAL